MADNTTLNTMSGGDVVEDIDGANGSTGVKRQVVALGGIGKSGSHTALVAGQATGANSIPVVLSSDPDSRPASGTITAQDTGSSSASGQDSIALVTGTPSASSSKSWAINGQATARIQITGTWTGTLAFEGSIDGGTTWFAQPTRVSGLVHTRSSVTGNGLFDVDVSGLSNLRVRSTASMTGTATVQTTFSQLCLNAPPAGVGVVGQRPFPTIKGTLAFGQTSYAQNKVIGGLLTVPVGLPGGTILTALALRIKYPGSNVTTAQALGGTFFDASPASTFSDGATWTFSNTADVSKNFFNQAPVGNTNINTSDMSFIHTFTATRLTVDSNGSFYFLCAPSSSSLVFTATGNLSYEVDGTY
jgi:hypothetical protein